MESLSEIINRINKEKFDPNINDNIESLDNECLVCNGARWILEDTEEANTRRNAIPCECQNEKNQNLDYLLKLRLFGLDKLKEFTFDNFRTDGSIGVSDGRNLSKNLELAKFYSEDPRGWLIITGPTGTGKTHIALGIAHACVKGNKPVTFKSMQNVIEEIRSTISTNNEDSYNILIDSPFLIIDDFGTQINSNWVEEKIDYLFTYRYNRKLPTVIVLNKSIFDFSDRFQMKFSDPNLVENIEFKSKNTENLNSGIEEIHKKSDLKSAFRAYENDKKFPIKSMIEITNDFINKSNPMWLFIYGVQGSGKSYLSSAIANELIKKGNEIFFIKVSNLLENVRNSYTNNQGNGILYERCKNVEYLFIDDLWGHSNSNWSDELIYKLLAHRQDNLKRTVINSNVDYKNIFGYDTNKTTKIGSDSEFTKWVCSRLSNVEQVNEIQLPPRDLRKHLFKKKKTNG